jgi:hypothetical protein
MDDKGQMILLAALTACLCLVGVMACVAAVDNSAYGEGHHFSSDGLTNARWAQESALRRTAIYYSTGPWDDRAPAVSGFKAAANTSAGNLSLALLKHGAAYRFLLNDSLAAEYTALDPDIENIAGVLMERNGSRANIRGCAYDIEVVDGSISYRLSRVVTFD